MSVNYSTQNGTAVAGLDYVSKTLLFAVKVDHLAEPDEYFIVNIPGAKIAKIADGRGIVTWAHWPTAAAGRANTEPSRA